MVKKAITNFRDWLDDHLRRLCGEITPEKRLLTIGIMFVVFAGASMYITISSIYNIGKRDDERKFMELEHIRSLELQRQDSINNLNLWDYGTESELE